MRRHASLLRRASFVALWFGATAVCACGETTIEITEPGAEPEPEVDLVLGLRAYLPFDETQAGATTRDASGNGHDGTPSENPPVPSLSVPPVGFDNPRSLAFDGLAQLVDLGNPASLDISERVTLSAWIRPLEVGDYRNIVAHGFRPMPMQELAFRIKNGRYEFLAWDGFDHGASAPVPEGEIDNWHHLCGVYDGRSYRIYRDGELLAERVDTFAPMRVDASWTIGGHLTADPNEGRFFSGLIDDVRIYDRALSAEEVRALFRR